MASLSKVVVLNFSDDSVHFLTVPEGTDNLEQWICTTLQCRIGDIEWMCSSQLTILVH